LVISCLWDAGGEVEVDCSKLRRKMQLASLRLARIGDSVDSSANRVMFQGSGISSSHSCGSSGYVYLPRWADDGWQGAQHESGLPVALGVTSACRYQQTPDKSIESSSPSLSSACL
jgi:hypothetical protein